jgi:hypothetical protein
MSFFKDNLQRLDFYPSSDGSRSLLLVSQINDDNLTPLEVFALENARDFKATAVYFRHFTDGRTSIPQIYIYDSTENKIDDKELAEIHRNLWSNNRVPLFIVLEKTEVKIFDARAPVKVSGGEIETSFIDKFSIFSDAVNLYSRKLFDSGVFWENEKAKGHFRESTSAYHDLIDNLRYVRREFLRIANLPPKTANKLLVFSILIKYLEERGELFAQDFFQKFGAKNFCEVLQQKGEIITLFDELSRHFNGKIFEWADGEERDLVQKTDLKHLALFLYGDIQLESGQYSFWRKYSFSHLPVELISTVYEEFLNERKDAVYTPEFLVNTLTDEVMPQREFEKLSVKTIDVSCGSGIFLVSVFKRLAQRHRYAEFKKTGKLATLTSKKLLQIIKDNIFGIDIEEDAVRLTIFSLCLALCDELTPKEIWTELKFDDTFKINFKAENFFDYLENIETKLGYFDLVIGNAPFVELSVKKDKGDIYYYVDKNNKEINLNLEISKKLDAKKTIFPQYQLALMFLDQSPRLLKADGILCLIMPASPLLYNNSAEFRKHFFPKHQVLQILDLTSLNSVLFGTANVPTAAIFVKKAVNNENLPITHIVVRRTKTVEEKIFFEIDKYDFHYVSQQSAVNDKHIWKCNLLGGGRLNNLIDRFLNIGTVGSYIKNKKKEGKDWHAGEGYIVGTEDTKDRKRADFITGKPSLPSDALDENGIDESKIFEETEEYFDRRRKVELFQPPVLLIREIIGVNKIPTYFSKEYLTFKHSIMGISAPKNDEKELCYLYSSFDENKEIYKLLITVRSNRYLVGKATSILKQDILNLPYSEDTEEMQLSYVEKIICDDVLKYQIELLAKGSNAKANWQKATITDLKSFGEVFSKALNSIYEETEKSFQMKRFFDWGEFYIVEFNYGVNTKDVEYEKVSEPTEHIKSLIETEYGRNAFLIKILKLYERNKIFLIKPKTLRFWLRSIALRDADEVFSDLIKAGY